MSAPPRPKPPNTEVTTLWQGAGVELQLHFGDLYVIVHEERQHRRRGRLTPEEASRLGAVLTYWAGPRV